MKLHEQARSGVAVAIHADDSKPPTTLPNISRRVEDYVDVRAITFSGNKIVVKTAGISQVPAAMSDVFFAVDAGRHPGRH